MSERDGRIHPSNPLSIISFITSYERAAPANMVEHEVGVEGDANHLEFAQYLKTMRRMVAHDD